MTIRKQLKKTSGLLIKLAALTAVSWGAGHQKPRAATPPKPPPPKDPPHDDRPAAQRKRDRKAAKRIEERRHRA